MSHQKTETNHDTPKTSTAAANNIVIQRSLAIGAVNDPLEHEADAIADKVMRIPEPFGNLTKSSSSKGSIQRKCAECEEEEEKVQRKPLASGITPFIQAKGSDTAGENVSHKINSTKGGGSSMDGGTKSFMESRFGTDFSGVKIHTGDYAVQMSQELNAQAFTVGSDVYFNSGKYNPNSNSGKQLLAHELTHTIQQEGASLIGKAQNIQRKSGVNLIQRAVTETKQESHAGFFELTKHDQLGGPTFRAPAKYDIKIEFNPYQIINCEEIAFTQTSVGLVNGTPAFASPADRSRALVAGEGTVGLGIDRLSGRTSPYYGVSNVGAAAGTTHFGKRFGTGAGEQKDKAWMTDIAGMTIRGAGTVLLMDYETCGICKKGTDTGVYYGCVSWGFDIDAADKFTEHPFALISRGTPSADFLAAAKKWNDQTVPVATDDLPLPTHGTKQTDMTEAQLKTEITTLETTLKGLAAGHVDIPQITFEIKVYKDILSAMADNRGRGYSPTDINAIQAVVGSTPNGTYDFDTIMKIKKWQVENSLKGDGRFGPLSKTKFDAIVTAAVTANKGKGFTAAQIKKIQLKVGSNDDGSWGPITVKNLMVWQKNNSLAPTGEFNNLTEIFMFGFFGF